MLKNSLLTLAAAFGCLIVSSGASMAMTAQECKDAGGTWTQMPLGFGACKIAITARAPKLTPIDDITKEECAKLGGKVSEDGKDCLIVTKGVKKIEEPKNIN